MSLRQGLSRRGVTRGLGFTRGQLPGGYDIQEASPEADRISKRLLAREVGSARDRIYKRLVVDGLYKRLATRGKDSYK